MSTEDIQNNNYGYNCKVSMCDTTQPTDLNYIKNNDATLFPDKIVIEFSKNINANLTIIVKEGQHVYIGDNIAIVNGIYVKSKREFIVDEIQKEYIIGTYVSGETVFNMDNENIEQEVSEYIKTQMESSNDEFSNLLETLNNQYYVDDYIINYMSFCRFSELALYTRDTADKKDQALSLYKFNQEYTTPVNNYITKFEQKIKNIASKENVKSKAEAGKILSLKKEIDTAKTNLLNNIVKHYNTNPGTIKYCSLGRLSDFLLYDMYYNFINDRKFRYDEKNKYIVKIYNTVNDIIAKRFVLETNADNVEALIESFNELCESKIKKYWKHFDGNYYEVLSNMFVFDYYTDKAILEEADESDKNKISIYNKVLEYLKAISNFTESSYYKITVDETSDINKLLEKQGQMSESSGYDKQKLELEDDLKYIARKFDSIRKVEKSMKAINISDYIDETVFKKVHDLRKFGGATIDEYVENTKYMEQDIRYNKDTILGPYIEMLRTLAKSESETFKNIATEIISEYESPDHNSLNMFNDFNEVSWPVAPRLLYVNNEKADWFLFDDTGDAKNITNIDDMLDFENEIEQDMKEENKNVNDNPEILDGYPQTKYGSNTYSYWLKYCCMATAVHCMLPAYWATGLILTNPVLMPVIYIPLKVIEGRVTVVIGLGQCGVMPSPMILFVNLGFLKGSVIVPVNLAVDYVMNLCNNLSNNVDKTVKDKLLPIVDNLDKDIIKTDKELSDIDFMINDISSIQVDTKTKKDISESIGVLTDFKNNQDTLKEYIDEFDFQKTDYKQLDSILNKIKKESS